MNDEAARKRRLALEAAGGRLVTSRPGDVRWLLCGRGRPVEDLGELATGGLPRPAIVTL